MEKLPPILRCMKRGNVRTSSRLSLAANLRAIRSLSRWSQEELGSLCGLKRTYVGALERREINPGIDNLDRIAYAIGVDCHVLLMTPELAYADIYAAYARSPRFEH